MWSSWISWGSGGCIGQLLHLSSSTKSRRIKKKNLYEKYKQTFQRCNWQLFLSFHMPRNTAKQQEAVINSKMNKHRRETLSRKNGDNGKRGQREGRGGSNITVHAEVITFYFIVLYFPHMMFHLQDLIITRLGGKHFRKWFLFIFFSDIFLEKTKLQWYTAHIPLCLSLVVLSRTLGHIRRLRVWSLNKVAGSSGKKVGSALCGCFQVLIMVGQTPCVWVSVGFHVHKLCVCGGD